MDAHVTAVAVALGLALLPRTTNAEDARPVAPPPVVYVAPPPSPLIPWQEPPPENRSGGFVFFVGLAVQAAIYAVGLSVYAASGSELFGGTKTALSIWGGSYLALSPSASSAVVWQAARTNRSEEGKLTWMMAGGYMGAAVTAALGAWFTWGTDTYTGEEMFAAPVLLVIFPLLLPPLGEALAYVHTRAPKEGDPDEAAMRGPSVSYILPAAIRAADGSGRVIPGMTLAAGTF
ncbi:MAG: hypothetical protein PHU25_18570 [Deltaproteobacteria bacterium]|nr:hypothetical protein [Deltaproteobacteria bacterium]